MLLGTIFGLFIVPGLYVAFGALADKMQLMKKEEETSLTENFENNE